MAVFYPNAADGGIRIPDRLLTAEVKHREL